MNYQALDQALLEIVRKRNKLHQLDYHHKEYDQVEEELHDLEDDFIEQYGQPLEDILQDVHDELCPDTDVLLPIAYLASHYIHTESDKKGGESFDVADNEGVPVVLDEYPDRYSRMVLVPTPPRILVQLGKSQRIQVWPEEAASGD